MPYQMKVRKFHKRHEVTKLDILFWGSMFLMMVVCPMLTLIN